MLYNENSYCVKCGSRKVSIQYDHQTNKLLRICRNCGYWWYEDPLDTITKGRLPAFPTEKGA